jgi:hypothetical protein
MPDSAVPVRTVLWANLSDHGITMAAPPGAGEVAKYALLAGSRRLAT